MRELDIVRHSFLFFSFCVETIAKRGKSQLGSWITISRISRMRTTPPPPSVSRCYITWPKIISAKPRDMNGEDYFRFSFRALRKLRLFVFEKLQNLVPHYPLYFIFHILFPSWDILQNWTKLGTCLSRQI